LAEKSVARLTVDATVNKPGSLTVEDDEKGFTVADVEQPYLQMRVLELRSPRGIGPGVSGFVLKNSQEHAPSLNAYMVSLHGL
jgi:hypothetical protein